MGLLGGSAAGPPSQPMSLVKQSTWALEMQAAAHSLNIQRNGVYLSVQQIQAAPEVFLNFLVEGGGEKFRAQGVKCVNA